MTALTRVAENPILMVGELSPAVAPCRGSQVCIAQMHCCALRWRIGCGEGLIMKRKIDVAILPVRVNKPCAIPGFMPGTHSSAFSIRGAAR